MWVTKICPIAIPAAAPASRTDAAENVKLEFRVKLFVRPFPQSLGVPCLHDMALLKLLVAFTAVARAAPIGLEESRRLQEALEVHTNSAPRLPPFSCWRLNSPYGIP